MAMINFLLSQECTIYPFIREYDGADVYGDPEKRKCRIQGGAYLKAQSLSGFTSASGVLDAISTDTIMYCTGNPIPPRSRIECNGRAYIVIDCYEAMGLKGVDHLEVLMQ